MARNILVRMKFGSHLYGTSHPESDTDYKSIYLPTIEECILRKVSNSIHDDTKQKGSDAKNTKDDVDDETYSLQYFLYMAAQGETIALDMIHAPDSAILIGSPEWEFIRQHRARFYTKSAKAYIGYVRRQAAKYGVKGSRLENAEQVLKVLKANELDARLSDIWDQLPEGEHIKRYEIAESPGDDKRVYDVCGKKLMATSPIRYALPTVQKFYDGYGARALLAKENQGVDWKAISHAFRASYQLKEIYETGDLIYPLKNAEFLRDLKLGKYHYLDDKIGEQLDALVDSMAAFSEASGYPEKVDQTFWNDWLVSLYK